VDVGLSVWGVSVSFYPMEDMLSPMPNLQFDSASRFLTANLMKILTECGHSFVATADGEIARDVKKDFYCIAF